MFDGNNDMNGFDQMMRSILDDGQEEVPARVWDAVSEGLDKAARHKRVVLWWRRAGVTVAAAAAVIAAVIFNMKPEAGLVPEAAGGDMIAVAEPAETNGEIYAPVHDPVTRHAYPTSAAEAIKASYQEVIEENVTVQTEVPAQETVQGVAKENAQETIRETVEKTGPQTQEYFPENWGEDEIKTKKNVSLVLSGLASTNSTQSNNRIGPMKAPTITSAPTRTGITETSTKSTYGLPVSFGAGVKVELSPRWAIGIGASYTLLTRQFYGKYTKVDNDGSIESATSSDIRNTQHFIGIPVNAYFNIANTDRINFYAYAGGAAEKCISDNYHVLSTSIRHKEKAQGIQLSANAGIGVEFMLGKHLGLYIDPSVRYYFDNGQPKSIRTAQPLMLGFEMGFRARL
jgi:hypothetical protein